MSALGWAFLLVVIAVAGFVAVNTYLDRHARPPGADIVEQPTPTPPELEPDRGVPPEEPPAAPAEPPPPPRAIIVGYGRDEPSIDETLGLAPAEGEGLVVFEPTAGRPIRVRFRDRDHLVADAPVAIAAPAGVHDVEFVRGDEASFRFIYVRPGHTRYVTTP